MDTKLFDELIEKAKIVKAKAEREGVDWLVREAQAQIEWAEDKKQRLRK